MDKKKSVVAATRRPYANCDVGLCQDVVRGNRFWRGGESRCGWYRTGACL